jgi:hypothetical protein
MSISGVVHTGAAALSRRDMHIYLYIHGYIFMLDSDFARVGGRGKGLTMESGMTRLNEIGMRTEASHSV